MSLDRTREGRRIKLIYSDDPYTKLKKGDLGTIKWERLDDLWGDDSVSVNWDSGSTLSLINGRDRYVVLDDPEGEYDGSLY